MKFDLKSKARGLLSQWNTPAKGKYVTLKEICAYSVGGMGVQFLAAIANNIAMSAGCLLVGSVYGLTPIEMQTIAVITTIITLVLIPIRGMIIDNIQTKQGKFRPIILWTAIPVAIITVAMAYIPLDASHMTKVVLIAAGFILINIFYNQLLYMAYSSLVQVISPNSDERTGIVTISSILYSLAPTITGFMMPMMAEMANSTMADIAVYRIAFPIFGVLGLVFTFFAYTGTKERIVTSKARKVKVKFWHGMKSVCTNKYLWISTIQSWFVFARNASTMILNWVFVYQMQDNVAMALLTTLMGTASLIGMVATPFIVKFIGKRNLIIGAHAIFGIAFGLTFFAINNAALLLVLIYIANIANSTAIITGPALNADILDYQQWKTGERLDGFFSNIGIISSILGIATGYVIPFITESYGLLTNYEVLFDASVRAGLIRILAVVSLIGAGASLVPFIFYDLNEKKHRKIMQELKKRTLGEDLENGIITQEEYDEQLQLIVEVEAEMLKKDEKRDNKKKALKNKFKTKNSKNSEVETITEDAVIDEISNLEGESTKSAVTQVDTNEEIIKTVSQLKEENKDNESEGGNL